MALANDPSRNTIGLRLTDRDLPNVDWFRVEGDTAIDTILETDIPTSREFNNDPDFNKANKLLKYAKADKTLRYQTHTVSFEPQIGKNRSTETGPAVTELQYGLAASNLRED